METLHLIIENPKNKLFRKVLNVENYTFGDFIKTAEVYYRAGFIVYFKRIV